MPASSLRLFHYTGGAWRDITVSVNTAARTVTGRTNSFSHFALFAPTSMPTVSTSAESPLTLALLGVLGLAILGMRARRRA